MRLLLTSFILAVGGTCILNAQTEFVPTFEDTLEVYEGLFSTDEPLQLMMKFDVRNFKRTRRKEEYQPAEMTCIVNDSFRVTHPVRIKARGIYRRDNCSLPPFWLNIRYSGIEADSLRGIRRMKMVVRCRHSTPYENYILREYLVYKMYNLITPYSFRVRLVRLTIVNTGNDNEVSSDWAFLIEPEELMAKRLNARVVKLNELSMKTVNSTLMDELAMFQYMIGNGDYSITGRHNVKILANNSTSGPYGFIPVPYDFDYTGLVNTHYAIPNESLGTKTVRERYYMGPCRSGPVHRHAIQKLILDQDEIVELITNFEYMEEEEKMNMIAYIAGFFVEAEQESFIRKRIASTCR